MKQPTRRPAVLRVLLPVVLLLFAGCRGAAPRPPLDPADPQALVERLSAHLAQHPEDDAARRDLAHVRWLHLGDAAAARPALEQLAERGDPLARLSRLVMAEARDEARVLQPLALAAVKAAAETSPDDPARALHLHAAELAARLLADHHGEQPDDDARVAGFIDALPSGRLPLAVTQPLSSLRAAIARRRDEPYRAYYEAQGCVQDFAAGPMQGSRGPVELSHTGPGPLVPDPTAEVARLACVVRLWNPSPSPGVRRVATHLQAAGGPVLLDLGAEEPSRVYLDGRLLHANDGIDRYGPGRAMLRVWLEAGWHRVEIHTAIPAERAWILLRAVEEDGNRPLPAKADDPGPLASAWSGRPQRVRAPWPEAVPGVEGPIYAPLRAWLAVEDALADGDSDTAERRVGALARADRFAEGHFMRARFERADPSRGRTVSLAREVEALERALELAPELDAVRLRLYETKRDRGEEDEVERILRTLPKGRLRSLDGELLRFSVLLGHGNEHLAERALARAARLGPDSCKVLMAERTLARDRADVRREDAIAAKLAACSGNLPLRARLAEARGRWDEARALWLVELERTPDELSAHENLARVEALRGDLSASRAHLETVLRHNPHRVGSHLALADLAATGGDLPAARAELVQALAKLPHSNALWRAAADLGVEDDLMRWRVDGLAALADYRAAGAEDGEVGQTLVLDRSVARVYESGGQRQIVHILAHLQSKEALDEYGELSIPEAAELLTLRTIKPDGRTLEPEIVPGKDGVSLRDLAIGDVVEYEYVLERGPAGAVPGYVDVSTFRFQSQEVPYHRSELLVVHPPSMELRFDPRNGPPVDQPSTVEIDGRTLTVHHFRADEVPRLGVEPGARPWLEELPSVHVYTALDLPLYLDGLAAQIRDTQRRNPALRTLVRRLVRGRPTARERLEALWGWVVENVEDAGDLAVPATATLAARTGSRLMLLRAMLREAGLPAELWLARDGYGPRPLPGGHPLVETYEAAMLAVSLPDEDEPLMVMTASKVMPLGYLAPGYRGTDGLRIRLEPSEGASGPVRLPAGDRGLRDLRRWDVDLELDREGAGTVSGTITLQGMEAILWRQALRQIDRDRIEEIFVQAELPWLPGATLDALEIEDEDALSRPLVLRFAATTSGMGVMQDGVLVLRATPMPLNPGAPFAALPRRTTGLVIPYAPELELELRWHVAGATLEALPRPRSVETELGRYVGEIEAGPTGGEAVVRVRSTVRPGVLPPERYGELTAFVRQVDAAMQDVLRAR
jgi:tetratricopeptide (TPR) repeat protein/transglutaminase-like putative cysteine protease